MRTLLRYESTPGALADAGQSWPAGSTLKRTSGQPTLVVLAHPQCVCTRASLSELNVVMQRLHGRLTAYVLYVQPHEMPERKAEMPAPDLSDLERRAIGVVQEDLPNVERPFVVQAEALGVDEQQVLDLLRSFKERKLMRRFAAVMNHRSAGFKATAMGVWAVRDAKLDELGPMMAGFAAVSHCYRRPTYDDWPYSVFTMVHGRSARDCEATIDAIRTETGVDEYCLLWSVKEYKKVRVRYFTPEWDEWQRTNLH